MKKFLLSMAMILGLASVAHAAETTLPADGKKWNDYTWTAEGSDFTATVDGYSFKLAKGNSETPLVSPDQYSIRIYKGANLTITAPAGVTFNTVKVTINTTGNKATTASAAGWEVTPLTDNVITLTSKTPQSSITFDGAEKQLRAASITLSDGEGGGTVTPDPTPDPEVMKVGSVAEMIALEDGVVFETTCTLQVGWVKFSNVFVCDPAGDFIQIYGSNTLQQGDIIPAGLKGSYKLFKGVTPEIENATIPAATAGTFVPKVVAAKDVTTALVNNVITIKNVVLEEASPAGKENFTATSEGVELSFRNNYTLESVAAGTYDITVVVTIFNDEPSLYVTKYETAGGAGINDITLDENAPVEYYNLQGVRIAEPAAGQIVIRRQGNNVSKVYVK